MKYIRTKDGRILLGTLNDNDLTGMVLDYQNGEIVKIPIIAKVNTIEELCDEFVQIQTDEYGNIYRDLYENYGGWLRHRKDSYYDFSLEQIRNKKVVIGGTLFGAIWTEKGLIYVAKMNEKGEMELL